MKQQKKKTSVKSPKTASRDQFGVILDDINGKFDVMVEGQRSLEQRFVSFKKDTESNFKQVFHYLSRIEDELMSIKADIADIKKTLTQKVDKDRVVLLEERVAKLERQLAHTTR
ncbi:hypothetical protein HY250_04050 [Candidatus Azambacteria bacterium]|nr:hypothetical protein [Candidatus Azambacteria bacterium]MBI3685549.1 hypothetical protein [Candidatus Azambacteria bacterium]